MAIVALVAALVVAATGGFRHVRSSTPTTNRPGHSQQGSATPPPASTPAGPPSSPTTSRTTSPTTCGPAGPVFGPEVQRYLRTRTSDVSAAVFDARNGRTYLFRPGLEYHTGSIVKVQIMGTLLRDMMRDGREPTEGESSELRLMIEISDNDSATALWDEVGGADGVLDFDRLAGMDHTQPNVQGYWGDTTTTALDNVRLIRHFAFPNDVLDDDRRAYGMHLMRSVIPADEWGVSSGVAPGTDVALKNGWLPIAPGDWEINSIGFVHGSGRRYVLAMLSHRNATMPYGVDTLDHVSAMVWNELRCSPR
jgi:hypothetical protein